MTVSARSYLTAGVAALAASAVVIAPVQPSAPAPVTAAAVRLSAAVQPLVSPVAAAAVLGATSSESSSSTSARTALAAASANSAASDWVISAWNWADYWISYAASLTQYVLGWVWPLSVIGDQAPLLWNNLGSPIGDAMVYGLIAPVLNDPLNPAVWSAGLTIVAQTTATALVNTAVAEFNYFIGWIIPPLPPLPFPPLPFAAAATAAAKTAAATSGTEPAAEPQSATPAVSSGTGHSARQRAVVTPSEAAPAAEAVTASDVKAATQDSPVAPSGVQKRATGGDAKPARDTAKQTRSTAGSARGHNQKTRASD